MGGYKPRTCAGGPPFPTMARLVTATLLPLAALAILSSAHAQPLPLDPSFGTNGVAYAGSGSRAITVDVEATAKDAALVLFRDETATAVTGRIVRLTPDGHRDASFGTNGQAFTPGPGFFNQPESLEIDADGRIVLGGTNRFFPNEPGRLLVVRFDESGQPDPSFRGTNTSDPLTDGVALYELAPGIDVRGGFAVPANGRIYVALTDAASQRCGIAVLDDSGALLMPGGEAVRWISADAGCRATALGAGTEGLILTGALSDGGETGLLTAGFQFDLSPLPGFGPTGVSTFSAGDGHQAFEQVEASADRFVLGGFSQKDDTYGWLLVSLTADGSMDPAFAGGLTWRPIASDIRTTWGGFVPSPRIPFGLTFDGDAVLAGGWYSGSGASGAETFRVLRDGTLDPSFGAGGTVRVAGPPLYRGGFLATDSQGRTLVSGNGEPAGSPTTVTWRLLPSDAPTSTLSLDLKALSDPTVPSTGGGIRYRAKVTNDGGTTASPDLWAIATTPTGGSPLLVRPRPRAIPAGQSYAKRYRLRVPENAPSGTYTVTYYVGTYPDDVAASASFDVTKAPSALGAPAPSGPFELTVEEDQVLAGLAVSPNPTSGQAWVEIDESGTVVVRDALGREVARVSGLGRLAVSTADLAPGVYVVTAETAIGTRTARLTVVR